MSTFGSGSHKEGGKPSFWKKNAKTLPGSIKPVYGAQHPPRQEPMSEPGTPKKELKRTSDSFQAFQDNTSDAWDDGDDDLIMMANVKMNLKDIHNTAMQVINNHSQQVQRASREPLIHRAPMSQSLPRGSTLEHHSRSTIHSSSANTTPTHVPNHRLSGPGLGVRMTHWHTPKAVPLQFGQLPVLDRESAKADKFKTLLQQPHLEINDLQQLSWSGIPQQYRPTTWKMLSGYLPPTLDRRKLTLQRKREEYYNFVKSYFETRHQEIHQDTFRQISIDIPRMSPLIPIFQHKIVQEIFERILYIWAIRHPASGYVQGINDLVTPFFVVFLTDYISNDVELDNCDLSQLPVEDLRCLEADCFWCFSKLLDGIQDNYTFAQPGIQLKVSSLKDLISRIDNELHNHLSGQHVEYLQFSFRWMNNLLMREMPLRCVIRLWDTYLSESDGFASFHLYVCAAFLTRFSPDLKRERDFQGLMLMLQNLPTHHWTNEEIGLVLAEAFKLKYMFADAPKHLNQKK